MSAPTTEQQATAKAVFFKGHHILHGGHLIEPNERALAAIDVIAVALADAAPGPPVLWRMVCASGGTHLADGLFDADGKPTPMWQTFDSEAGAGLAAGIADVPGSPHNRGCGPHTTDALGVIAPRKD